MLRQQSQGSLLFSFRCRDLQWLFGFEDGRYRRMPLQVQHFAFDGTCSDRVWA
jgi:hypothetical protein